MTTSTFEMKNSFVSNAVNFGKMTSWKPIVVKNNRVTDDNFLLDNLMKNEFKNSKYYRVKNIEFGKQKPRDTEENRLPGFMDGLNNRTSIEQLNRKMMQINHFDDSNF